MDCNQNVITPPAISGADRIRQNRERRAERDRRGQECLEFLKVLHPQGSVFEIRALAVGGKDPRKDSGYFDDPLKAAQAVIKLDEEQPPRGIYVTLNPVIKDLLARSNNRLTDWAKTMSGDVDVVTRRWLFVDLDPERPSGISATSSEKQAAIERAEAVREWLMSEFGFGEPVECDSGNGRYLLWPIELLNDADATKLIHDVLEAIGQHCGTSAAKIDTTVSNASRIMRLPGTMNRKGDSTADRPHRLAAVVQVPDYLRNGWNEPVPREKLEAVAALARERKATERLPVTRSSSSHQQPTSRANVVERARRYLAKIPPAIDGQRGSPATLLAAEHLVRGFELTDDEAFNLLLDWNQSCDPPWSEPDLRRKITEAREKGTAVEWGQHLRRDSEADSSRGSTPTLSVGIRVRATDTNEIGTVRADRGAVCLVEFLRPDDTTQERELPKSDLMNEDGSALTENGFVLRPKTLSDFIAMDFPQHYLVNQVLIAGQLCVVGAPKKTLKTSLCCDLAFSLATATPFLGRFPVSVPVRVLLLSAESGPAKLQKTFRLIAQSREMEPRSDGIFIEHEVVPQLACQEHLEAIANKVIELRCHVVILDPLYLMLLGGSDRPINPSDMFQMGMLLKSVDEAIKKTGATLVLVHHATKAAGRTFQPLDLDDLSQAGIAAFARQWMLLSPKAKFDTNTGTHELFLEIGGSAGHFGSYAMTVVEGRSDDPINGKRWHVLLKDANTAREHEQRDKERRKEVEASNALAADLQRLVSELSKPDSKDGLTHSNAARKLGWNNSKGRPIVAAAFERELIESCMVKAGNGQGYEGFRLKAGTPSELCDLRTLQLALPTVHSDTPTHPDKHSDSHSARTHSDTGAI